MHNVFPFNANHLRTPLLNTKSNFKYTTILKSYELPNEGQISETLC
jgi:hypothetical protein